MAVRLPCLLMIAACAAPCAGAAATPAESLERLQAGHANRVAGEASPDLAGKSTPAALSCIVMPPQSPVAVDWLFDAHPSTLLRVACDTAGIAALERAITHEGATMVVVVGVDAEDARLTLEGLRHESAVLDSACAQGRVAAATAVLPPGSVRLAWQEVFFAPPDAIVDASADKPFSLDAQLAAAVQQRDEASQPTPSEATNFHPVQHIGDRPVAVIAATATDLAPPEPGSIGIGSVIVFLCGAIASCLILLAGLNGRFPQLGDLLQRARGYLPTAIPAGNFAPSHDPVGALSPTPVSEELSDAVDRLEAKLRTWRADWRAMRDGLSSDFDTADLAVDETNTAAQAAVEAAAELRESIGQWAGDEVATRDIVRRLGDLSAQAKVLASSAAGGSIRKVTNDCYDTVDQLARAMRSRPDPKAASAAADDVQRHSGAVREQLGVVAAAVRQARARLAGNAA